MEKTEITTIQISKPTREKLADMGKKGETYDDIIKKLIEKAKECEKK
jgi:predicted CopG family antitoxin